MSFWMKPSMAILLGALLATQATAGPAKTSLHLTFDQAQTKRLAMSRGDTDFGTQTQGTWVITVVGDNDVPQDAGLTLRLEGTEVEIFGGCNQIRAKADAGGSDFRFENISATKKACEAEIMDRENALIDAMSKVRTMSVGAGDSLVFYDNFNRRLLAALRPAQ